MLDGNIKITSRKGHQLHATIVLPANQKPRRLAIFAHCFTCTSNYNAIRHITNALNNIGFGVIRFDFTGLGKSEGEFKESTFSANINDIADVHQFVKENYFAPELMIGHSLGGAAAIIAAHQIADIKAVATIGAPSKVEHIKERFSHIDENSPNHENIKVDIGGRPFVINKDFIDDLGKINILDQVHQLKKPLLLLHGPFDTIVGIENAQELYQAAFHPKSFISLDEADHLLLKKEDSMYVGEMIGTWVKKYFPEQENEMLSPNGEQLVGHLNLKENNFTTYIQTNKHSMIADEPASIGGDDFGPSPYDLLVAGLASCTAMTIKLYAERKQWDLHDIFVYITHSKRHSDDIDMETTQKGFLDFMSQKIKFIGNLDETQQQKLLEIAAKCPVHKTLEGQVIFEIELI